jgi:glycosyltransferase involved in cell wall biosynthesis
LWRGLLTAPGVSPARRAALAARLGAIADADLRAGRMPQGLSQAMTAELAVADAELRHRDTGQAVDALRRVAALMFHRGIHFDSVASPAAADPSGFFRPLHRSTIGQLLAAPRGRSAPAAGPPADRPTRILFLTRGNVNFLGTIRERYEQHPGSEVRSLDLAGDKRLRDEKAMLRHALEPDPAYGRQLEEVLRPQLEWADTVFVEWCGLHAAALSLIDPGSTRVIVRLHSFEAFTLWPHVIDWSRVDDLVFVSEPLRAFTLASVPRLRRSDGPRTPVVTNAIELTRYERPKVAGARFTVGLVGFSAIAKDPSWAVEVLRELRRHDERYRLLLIGKDVDGKPSGAAGRYHQEFARALAELEPGGAIRRYGQTEDVPRALTEVGVILSSSVREGFPLGLTEGTASGAVPVVRDWPFFAGRRSSARDIFPAEWMVDTPAQAAARIRAVTETEESWRTAGDAAAAHALAHWDWSKTQSEYDRLLLPGA